MTSVSLVIESEDKINNLLMIIKRHTNLGLSAIKTCIQNKESIMSVDYLKIDDMEKMRVLVEELLGINVKFKLYEQHNDKIKEFPLQLFMNTFELERQINEEMKLTDDILSEENDENED